MNRQQIFTNARSGRNQPDARAAKIFQELRNDGYQLRDLICLSNQLLTLVMAELKKN